MWRQDSIVAMSLLLLLAVGCAPSANPELAKAKASADAAQAEVTSLRMALDQATAEIKSLREAAEKENGKDLERILRLARTIAEGALNAVMKANSQELQGFCTPAEQKRSTSITVPVGKLVWTIDSEQMGASGREATFKGHFDWTGGKIQFVILVIRYNDAGNDRWLVDAISIGS